MKNSLNIFFLLSCLSSVPKFSLAGTTTPKKILQTFNKIASFFDDEEVVLSGSLAVYFHALNKPFISKEEKDLLIKGIKDIDLVVEDPSTIGSFIFEEFLNEKKIVFRQESLVFEIDGVKIDLLSHLSKRTKTFTSFCETACTVALSPERRLRLESVTTLLKRYKSDIGLRSSEQRTKDTFKITLLERILENRTSSEEVTPIPKTRRKSFDASLVKAGLRF